MFGKAGIRRFRREGGCMELCDVLEGDEEWIERSKCKAQLETWLAEGRSTDSGAIGALEVRFVKPVW